MKSTKAGLAAGCVTWIITFVLLGSCLLPVGGAIGGITSGLAPDFVTNTLGPYFCPEGSQAQVHTYETTAQDENGFDYATTAYESRCIDASGKVIKDLGPTLFFAWTGIIIGAGLIAAILLTFIFAAPVGALVAKLLSRRSQ